MIKLFNKQDDSIKFYTNGGRSNYYFINTEYLREVSKSHISLVKLEFNLIFKTLVITDFSLLKILLFMSLIITASLFYNTTIEYDNVLIVYAVFVILYIFNVFASFGMLFILSTITNIVDRTKQLLSFLKFNISNFKTK